MRKNLLSYAAIIMSLILLAGLSPIAKAGNGVITDDPVALTNFFEDFNDLDQPALPEGWTAYVDATTTLATIGTSLLGTPYSPPLHLRFANSNDADAVMIASTPLVTNFGSNRLSFWGAISAAGQTADLAIGYTTNPNSPGAFVGIDTVAIDDAGYKQYFITLDGLVDTDEYHIAFKFLPGVNFRTIYIDDVSWDVTPTTPLVDIVPDPGDFGSVDLGDERTRTFTIRNVGVGTLTINDGDFSISGDDAAMFEITGVIDYPIELALNETVDVDIKFTPASEGLKNANWEIVSNSSVSPYIFPIFGVGLGTLTDFFEDFNGAEPPLLPDGWSSIVITESGNISTVTVTGPYSPPNHLRMQNQSDLNATLVLVSPKVNNFDTNWLRFQSKMSSAAHSENLILGYMSDRNDLETFVPVDTLLVEGNVYYNYAGFFSEVLDDTDEYHLAFRFIPNTTFRNLFLDDISWDTAPLEPILVLSDEEYDFGLLQYGTVSEPVEFSIFNDGAVPVTVSPADITITGADASDFILYNLDEPVVIEHAESAVFSVSFAPEAIGLKTATIEVFDMEISITGEGGDATLVDFPHLEGFDEVTVPDLPFGWKSIVYNPSQPGALVATTTASSPLSPPAHLRMFSNNDTEAVIMAITPPIVDLDNKRLRFWAKCNLNSNVPDLLVGTMSDPEDENTFVPLQVFVGGEDLNNTYQEFMVIFDETIGENNHIAFRQGPTPNLTRSIFIDDIIIDVNPTEPVLVVDPDSWTFDPTQIGTSLAPQEFILSNDGLGVLNVAPENISISGPDADVFILNNLDEAVALEQFETAAISVAYAPVEIGEHQATLNILDMEISLSGSSFDATITEVPHLENFDDVTPPDLPLGWTSIVDNPSLAAARVETSTVASPLSPPNHVRLNSNDDPDAIVMLVSPPVVDLNTLRVRFWAKCNLATNVPDLVVGTMTNPSDAETFLPIDTIVANEMLTNSYDEQFSVNFVLAGDEHTHFAFKHAGTPNFARFIYIDDIVLEAIPDEPVIVVTPETHNFSMVQIGEVTAPVDFTILNDGGGLLTLAPEDIEITGANASEFVLNNLAETVNLSAGQSTTISVAFAPETVGNKEATLVIDGEVSIPLLGEGFDATIATFPWTENFEGIANGQIPFGWTRNRTNWGVNSSSNAGGQAPELRFHYNPTFDGIGYVQTPRINTTGYDEMMLSFKSMVNNFTTPGPYTLRIVTVVGDTEHLVHEWVDPSDIAADDYSFILTAEDHGIGAESMFIKFLLDGESNGINQWYLDDIVLEEAPDRYTVTFNVEDEDGVTIPDAIVTFGDVTNDPGDYVFTEVFEGSYGYTVTADEFETVVVETVEITDDTTINVVMTRLTYTVTFNVEDTDGNAITDAVITFDGNTNDAGNYVFENVLPGSYDYSVEAGGFVTVSVQNFEVTGDTTIEVEMAPQTYTVTFIVEDENGAAITDAVITLNGETNAAGDYVFDDILAGTYSYTVTADEFITVVEDDFVVDSDMTETVVMTAVTYTITFVVEDEDGAPIADAVVTFGETTNAPGDYVFDGILAGTYDYAVEADGYHTFAATGYEVTEDATIEVTLTLVTYTVTFVVKDEQGDDITHAVITFGDITNDAGDYIFENILPGDYDYTVEADGFETVAVEDFTVDNDVTIEVQLIAIIPTFTVTFNVEDADGNAITDAEITFDGVAYGAGVYVFEELEAGVYPYIVSREGYFDVTGDVTVTDDDVVVEITMEIDDTSVPETGIANLTLYPNPTSSMLNVVSGDVISEIRVIDMLGNVVYANTVNHERYEFNVSSLQNGVYFIQVLTTKGMQTQRFQVAK
jgi:hypothetical protein